MTNQGLRGVMLPRILGRTPIEAGEARLRRQSQVNRKVPRRGNAPNQLEIFRPVRLCSGQAFAQDDKITRGTRLNLIGAVAGSDGLGRVGLGSRAGSSRF